VVRELRRLLLSPERLSAAADRAPVPLEPDERHYLSRVLRLRRGEAFAVVDGQGHLWQARFDDRHACLQQPLQQPFQQQPSPTVLLQLAVAMPRRDTDVLLRMVTELGIDRLVPLLAERSVTERWNPQRSAVILREAVEQCERLWAPALTEPQPAVAWFADAEPWPQGAAGTGSGAGVRLLATTRRAQVPELAELLRTLSPQGPITLALGPEGGWTPSEERQALAFNWRPVGLGPTILRTSTAAVAAATLLCSWRQGLSS